MGDDCNATPQLDRYVNLEPIGYGATAVVYKAYDQLDERHVAIKLMRPGHFDEETFVEEAQRLEFLRADCFPDVIELDVCDGQPFIVFEFIEGATLDNWREQHANASHVEIATIITNVADALTLAHKAHVVHRDVKPANIIVRENLDIVLVDFGLGLSATDAADIVRGRGRKGTVGYMAPEMAIGVACRVDGRMDIYSLGVIFYELLTGHVPNFDRPSPDQLLSDEYRYHRSAVYDGDPQPLRQIDENAPPVFAAVIERCLKKRPADRYETCADIARELREWIASVAESVSTAQPGITIAKPRVPRAHRMGIALCVLLAALVALLWNLLPIETALEGTNDDPSTPVLFRDTFDDQWPDYEKWQFPRPGVKESEGWLRLQNRGCAITWREFPPPIEIRFRWRWVDVASHPSYAELLTIALKTPGKMRDNHPFDIDDGILIRINTQEGAFYLNRAIEGQVHQIPWGSSGSPPIPLPANEWHDVRITDDGAVIKLFIRGKTSGDVFWEQAVMTVRYSDEFKAHRIAIYNREIAGGASHLSQIDDVVIRAISVSPTE